MAPAWWSESASASLEDPSSFTAVTRQDPSGHNGGDRGSEELPAPARSAWQSCLPAVVLMILTSLLLGTAVTTVLRMNDILPAPADETQVTPHTTGDASGPSEVEAMMTPRRFFLQPTIAAVRPRATFRRAHHKAGLEMDSGREVKTGRSSFESAPAVHARRRGIHRSHLVRRASMTKPENATSPPSNTKTAVPGCQEPSHTYCTGSEPEYFYSSLADACVLASENPVQLCNRGRNKFSSLNRCEMHCVRAEQPHLDCLEKPQFTACKRQDCLVTIPKWAITRKFGS
ncbi:hypothetical protein HPB51_023166 [Rhipicephalus microplus]|uniref:Bovine pancreatic trypsin inhibitor n=1 Tax=Rhipicephalus microplus TaxID=6941 RepID=A0A9J6DJI7_RHIMP|nr:hypothetical protein HPB51_023166 [Rhipicephalus microplus]